MQQIYKDYLFTRNILIATGAEPTIKETLYTLATKWNIDIIEGQKYASIDIIKEVENYIPLNIPQSFYKNFPMSVRELSKFELLFDQVFHYWNTYGEGNFDNPGHSIFESEEIKREVFREIAAIKQFKIVSEYDAYVLIRNYVKDLCQSTRPLSETAYQLVKKGLGDGIDVDSIASSNTAMRLLKDTEDIKYVKYIKLSEILKFVEIYSEQSLNKLNLNNKQRKFISSILDNINYNRSQTEICFERRKNWKGLLHHIHYKPKTDSAMLFVNAIRNLATNVSIPATVDRYLEIDDPVSAAIQIKENKGNGALLRNLNYLLSRCNNEEDAQKIISFIDNKNPIILIQLLLQYKNYSVNRRTFTFTKNCKFKRYVETPLESAKRKSIISKDIINIVVEELNLKLKLFYQNKLGKVYIDENMKNIALPLQETTSQSGYKVLPKGSKIQIPDIKKIRLFTYWEKVNDIDLSLLGMKEDGSMIEFSWRSMRNNQNEAITFSGDQTSGYNGGSEFFDVNLSYVKQKYPDVKYLVCCNNVYSGSPFSNCICKAGYMLREDVDAGEVWEPKSVETSFVINCDSTFAYLFAINLNDNSLIWLNIADDTNSRVAGENNISFIDKYINILDIINVYKLFEMMATEIVDNPNNADVVVSDNIKDAITSFDIEKIMKYMNGIIG